MIVRKIYPLWKGVLEKVDALEIVEDEHGQGISFIVPSFCTPPIYHLVNEFDDHYGFMDIHEMSGVARGLHCISNSKERRS